jgi:site-specific DNA-methyltransferase (adenine-specific)
VVRLDPRRQETHRQDIYMKYELKLGDCLDVLRAMPDCSVDSIVTDPPYGLSFMGKKWDYDVPSVEVWEECLRVLKPGGHLLAFAGTRTQHRMAVRIEDAGFEIRDMIAWVYGSGFPKSLDVSKAIDKAAGAEREVIGPSRANVRTDLKYGGNDPAHNHGRLGAVTHPPVTAPATDAARQWAGWGTALKPALEPITVARKPFPGTVAANVLAHGTGALNVDGCRVATEDGKPAWDYKNGPQGRTGAGTWNEKNCGYKPITDAYTAPITGRFPANLIHDGSDEVLAGFPVTKSAPFQRRGGTGNVWSGPITAQDGEQGYSDTGSAARFFYCAKASKADRDEGLDSSRTVKHTTGLCKEENMELAASLQKATCGSTVRWGIDESGGSITGLCPLASLSTTLTAISKITTSEIFNSWMPSHTKESTADVNFETANGGNLVENAEESKESQRITTSENQAESARGANSVVSKMLSSISDAGNWQPATNFHATVKPTDLMRYLCRLVTPPEGIVLDPFMGSGSTGKAAVLEGFEFIGIERDADYLEIATSRIQATHRQDLSMTYQ